MKHLLFLAFAAVTVLATVTATTMLRSHSSPIDRAVGPSGMMSLQELVAAAGANKLPIEEFEDQSLVYSNVTRR